MYIAYSTIAVFLIGVFISYVYIKKSKYGLILLFIALMLTGSAVYWNLSENSRLTNSLQKIPLEQLTLSESRIVAAYRNKYLYKAKLNNNSADSKLKAIQLKLSLTGKNSDSIKQWLKVWLSPNQSKQIDVYFSSKNIAETLKPGNWKVSIVTAKAKI